MTTDDYLVVYVGVEKDSHLHYFSSLFLQLNLFLIDTNSFLQLEQINWSFDRKHLRMM
jgi:hypothetical protein